MRASLTLVTTVAALLFAGGAVAVDLKQARPVAAAASEQARVADAVRGLGFTVRAVTPAGQGQWDVQVESWDPAHASALLRGVVRGPATRFAVPGQAAMATRGAVRGGVRPLGGAADSDADGSQTGSGGSGGTPDDPFGIGGNGGGTGGDSGDGGGSATGAGGDSGPDTAGGGQPRNAGVLRVGTEAGGALRVDARSLRALGLDAGAKAAPGANLQIR